MIGCLPTQALAFLAVFVYATHATQAIAFEWKPGFTNLQLSFFVFLCPLLRQKKHSLILFVLQQKITKIIVVDAGETEIVEKTFV